MLHQRPQARIPIGLEHCVLPGATRIMELNSDFFSQALVARAAARRAFALEANRDLARRLRAHPGPAGEVTALSRPDFEPVLRYVRR